MLRIRRLYFYLVLYLSMWMVLVGSAALVRVTFDRLFDIASTGFFGLFVGQVQEQTAMGIALVLVGSPVWLLHWRTVQGWLDGPAGSADRTSAVRRLYVYAVLFTTAIVVYSSGRDLLESLISIAVGQTTRINGITVTLPVVMIGAAVWGYHVWIAHVDRRLVGEQGASASLRRWYLYGMLTLSVLPLMINLALLGQQAWETIVGQTLPLQPQVGLGRAVASNGATLLAAGAVWLGFQAWSRPLTRVSHWYGEAESASTLRKVYLYGIVAICIGCSLFNASEIVRFALAAALGVAPAAIGATPVVIALGAPLASALVFGSFWIFHWRSVTREAAAQVEVGRQSGVRRIYFYLVSAVALGFVAWSAANLVRLAGDMLLQQTLVDPSTARADLARSLSWLIVGLPTWLWHWSRSQALTRSALGMQETRSTTRRCYLYIVVFSAVAVLLFSGARLIYELVLLALGRAADQEMLSGVTSAVAYGAVAAALVWYHWYLVLRADLGALRGVALERRGVAVISGLDAEDTQRLKEFARTVLDGSRMRIYWTDQAHARETLASVGRAEPPPATEAS